MAKINVLFVCMGNICRSPTAQGIFTERVLTRALNDQVFVDSAGTHDYHVGQPPDHRTQAAADGRGFDLSVLRARQVEAADFARFQYVIAMDQQNLHNLRQLAGAEYASHLYLLMDFARRWNEREVPDPYYGGEHGFERVLDMIEDAADGLLMHLHSQHFADL